MNTKRLLRILLALVLTLGVFLSLAGTALAASKYEMEPNDSIAYANTISNGVTMCGDTGSSYSGSHDYFKFTLEQDSMVTMKLGVTKSNASIQFGDAYETFEYYNSFYRYAGYDGFRREVTKHLCAGTYYLTVIRSTGEYELDVSWYARSTACPHYGTWTTKVYATCTEDGLATRKCTSCGMKQYEVREAKGHNLSEMQYITEATCLTGGEMGQKCSRCYTWENRTDVGPLGHDWDYGFLAYDPEVGQAGETIHTCLRCGENDYREVAALTDYDPLLGVVWEEIPVFDGSAQEPKPIISYAGVELVEGQDYTLEYSNNVIASNKAVVIITGYGEYEDLYAAVPFVIRAADIASLEDTFQVSDMNYTGGQLTPDSIVLTDGQGKTLQEGVDFFVFCTNNTEVGTANIRLMGIDNYTGSLAGTFEIAPVATVEEGDLNLTVEPGLEGARYRMSADSQMVLDYADDLYEGTVYVDDTYAYNYNDRYTLEPGFHKVTQNYTISERVCSYEYVNGTMKQVCRTQTSYKEIEWYVNVIDNTPAEPDELIAEFPTAQGPKTLYLAVGSENNGNVKDIVWETDNAAVADVEDGVVTLYKPGAVTITATVGEESVKWYFTEETFAAITLTKHAQIMGYDPDSGKVLVTWKNYLLTEGEDYTVSTKNVNGKTAVTVTGINNFTDSVTQAYYAGTPYVYNCQADAHVDTDPANDVCDICGTAYESWVNPFTDVSKDKFYYEPVKWAVRNGITTGKTATTFGPTEACTRAQVVTFLWRAAGKPEPTSVENPFPDVADGKYFTKAVLWAAEQGITGGYSDGTFRPDNACTRDQIVTFLWRYMGKPAPASMENTFPDVVEGKFYTEAVLWAAQEGITGGYKDGTFRPSSTCTRDQIVTFLYRAIV